jgi:hypothetical protein
MWERLGAVVADLKRRKVFLVTSIYLVAAWGLALGVSELSQTFQIQATWVRYFVIVLVVLLPVVAGCAWYFDITRRGIVVDRGPLADTVLVSSVQVVWDGASGRETRIFDRAFEIGRDARCEVHTLEPVASRRHARIEPRDGDWWLVDLDSSNGTWLDGRRVREARLAGDLRVSLGEVGLDLEVRVLDQGATTVALPGDR